MPGKAITVAKSPLVASIQKRINEVGGGRKKHTDPKIEGHVAGLREAMAIVSTAKAA